MSRIQHQFGIFTLKFVCQKENQQEHAEDRLISTDYMPRVACGNSIVPALVALDLHKFTRILISIILVQLVLKVSRTCFFRYWSYSFHESLWTMHNARPQISCFPHNGVVLHNLERLWTTSYDAHPYIWSRRRFTAPVGLRSEIRNLSQNMSCGWFCFSNAPAATTPVIQPFIQMQ